MFKNRFKKSKVVGPASTSEPTPLSEDAQEAIKLKEDNEKYQTAAAMLRRISFAIVEKETKLPVLEQQLSDARASLLDASTDPDPKAKIRAMVPVKELRQKIDTLEANISLNRTTKTSLEVAMQNKLEIGLLNEINSTADFFYVDRDDVHDTVFALKENSDHSADIRNILGVLHGEDLAECNDEFEEELRIAKHKKALRSGPSATVKEQCLDSDRTSAPTPFIEQKADVEIAMLTREVKLLRVAATM
jgi:hypothetical protein